jgi:hypothetical protein
MGLVHCLLAGMVLVLALDHFDLLNMGPNLSNQLINPHVVSATVGTGSNKGDRLAAPRVETGHAKIVHVEIIGVRDVAIVYRNREGKTLFRNDSLTGTTIVAKNVDLPEVTIGDRNDTFVRPKPITPPPTAERSKLRIGCDPAFGPLVEPSLQGVTGRCLTRNPAAAKFAVHKHIVSEGNV